MKMNPEIIVHRKGAVHNIILAMEWSGPISG
jgi:hypothetical protein